MPYLINPLKFKLKEPIFKFADILTLLTLTINFSYFLKQIGLFDESIIVMAEAMNSVFPALTEKIKKFELKK